MYRQVYKLYKRIFSKLLDYYKHVEKGIEFGYSSNGLNNCAIYGSKFGLVFDDPHNIKDLYLGYIGSADEKKIKAYYYHFDLCFSIEKVDYVELICEDTGTNITNKNLPPLGYDIKPQTEPFINMVKLKFVIGQYLSFYKKLNKDIKKRICEEKSKEEEFSYPSSDSDCDQEFSKNIYTEQKKKYLPKNYPIVSPITDKQKTAIDLWNADMKSCNSVCSLLTKCDCCDDLICKKCGDPSKTIKYFNPEDYQDSQHSTLQYDISISNSSNNRQELEYDIMKKNNSYHQPELKYNAIDKNNETKERGNLKKNENILYALEKISLNLDLDNDIDNVIKIKKEKKYNKKSHSRHKHHHKKKRRSSSS
jgi:hypothetical protein